MLSASKIKNGDAIIFNGEPYIVASFQFVQPPKGPSFVKCKIKNLKNAKVLEVTFKSSDNIEEANITKGNGQFLYKSGNNLVFMDNDSYEQYEIDSEIVGPATEFLKEGINCVIMFLDGTAFNAEVPKKVDLKVTESVDAVKGNTAGTAMKTVTLESGKTILVPLFVKEGDTVRINTETGTYVERV
jgi:elongation factor P